MSGEARGVVVVPCSGIGKAFGSVGREAAYELCDNLRPACTRLVALSKLVLATTKDHAHRIYLGHGIYAEVTLQYAHGGWQTMPWTYPDYARPEYHAFFVQVRERFRAQQQSAASAPADESREPP